MVMLGSLDSVSVLYDIAVLVAPDWYCKKISTNCTEKSSEQPKTAMERRRKNKVNFIASSWESYCQA